LDGGGDGVCFGVVGSGFVFVKRDVWSKRCFVVELARVLDTDLARRTTRYHEDGD